MGFLHGVVGALAVADLFGALHPWVLPWGAIVLVVAYGVNYVAREGML